MSNRNKGKRGERWFVHRLESVFPEIRRNAGTQSQSGGVDLENAGCFNFECKFGKRYNYAGIRKMLDQVKEEGKPENFDAVLIKPHREDAYVLMPFDDFLAILNLMRAEGIL